MRKTTIKLIAMLCTIVNLVSCSPPPSQPGGTNETAERTTAGVVTPAGSTAGETVGGVAETDPPQEESGLIKGIEPVAYPDPYAVSEYEKLTEDQKIAYDAISAALIDVTANGPDTEKIYSLERRVSYFDYKLSYNIIYANFTAAEQFQFNYYDTQGSKDHVDHLKLFASDHLTEYYQTYTETVSEADKILSTIEHDGSDYGKAFAIAKWLVDNVIYPENTHVSKDLNSVYTALISREAKCGGYAKSYDLLCKKAGLETIYVTGETNRNVLHAWNMICLDGDWYYVDTTWMTKDDYYTNFLMSYEISTFLGHDEHFYYWDQENNVFVTPVADSYKLYRHSYDSVEEIFKGLDETGLANSSSDCILFLSEEGIDTGGSGGIMNPKVIILNSVSDEELMTHKGAGFVSEKDGETYFFRSDGSTSPYAISFIKKLH